MDQDAVINLATQAMTLALKVAVPLLLAGLVVGLMVSDLPGGHADPGADALVHPEDPRDVAAIVIVLGPWMLDQLVSYTPSCTCRSRGWCGG